MTANGFIDYESVTRGYYTPRKKNTDQPLCFVGLPNGQNLLDFRNKRQKIIWSEIESAIYEIEHFTA